MKIHYLLSLSFALLGASGCPTRDKYDPMPIVQITAPTPETYTNGVVHIETRINPDVALPITLRRGDGVDLAVLPAAVRTFDWNTTTFPEGRYTITAEVMFSNGKVSSSPVTIVVDRQPPTAVLTPSPGTVDVKLRAPIGVVFSEPVLLSSPLSSAFTMTADTFAVPTTATMAADGRSFTIAIDDFFSIWPPAVLAISIAGTITDRAGNAWSGPTPWSWTVPAWIFLPAFASAIQPVITLGTDELPVVGHAVPAAMGLSSVAVSRYDGAAWIHLPPASGEGVAAAAGVSVAVDSRNRIFVAWSDYGTGSRFINVRRWDGANWDATIPILDAVGATGTDAVAPQIRFDRTDHLVVSWIENGDVFLARWSGSAWDRPWSNLGLSSATANDIALDAEGDPVVAWRVQSSDQGLSVWGNGAWTNTTLPASSQPPIVALDSAQAPMTAVALYDSILLLRVVNRQAPLATDPLDTNVGDTNPRFVVDAQANPAIVWLNATGKRLRFGRWTGTVWNTRAGYFDDGSGSLEETTAPQIAADASGTAWIAWRQSGAVHVRMTNH